MNLQAMRDARIQELMDQIAEAEAYLAKVIAMTDEKRSERLTEARENLIRLRFQLDHFLR